jgi:hypothetical protein
MHLNLAHVANQQDSDAPNKPSQPWDAQHSEGPSIPASGPHDRPELTDDSKTPGTGTLPKLGKSDDSTSG